MPDEVRHKFIVRGMTSVVDDDKKFNNERRNKLWMDLCGFSKKMPGATFEAAHNNPDEFIFEGPIQDVWNDTDNEKGVRFTPPDNN